MSLLTIYKIFDALGNERPQILVQLEDFVLECIISISEGKPREEAVQFLYSRISPLMKDLGKDAEALGWFNLYNDAGAINTESIDSDSESTPPPPEFPSMSDVSEDLPNYVNEDAFSNHAGAIHATPLESELPSTPLPRASIECLSILCLTFLEISRIISSTGSKVSDVY